MLTREQAVEAIELVMAQYSQEEIRFRDVMAREQQVSVTILGADKKQQTAIEAALRDALTALGAETIHCRFRDEGAGKEDSSTVSEKQQSSKAKKQEGAVQGHGAGLDSTLLGEGSKTIFIAVASGKGGVGKSTVTVNLAATLAREGKRVGIIDADIYGFSVPDMMGIEERPEIINEKVIPIEKFGVKVMSMGFFVEDNSPIVWRGPMLGKMLRNFFQEIEWGQLDYLLLDLPPGTGDIALDVHQIIPHSKEIIVTTPHATAAFVAARAGAMAIKTEHEIVGVVENMSYYLSPSTGEKEYVFGRGGGGRLAETLNCDLLAQIPLGAPDNHPAEPDFSPSVYKEETEIGQLYKELAKAVISKCE